MRQILAQGYRIGIEYVDERRFRTGSWKSSTTSQINGESDAIAAMEACLAEHSGEYVRLVGIDPKAKRRAVEMIIQRPNDKFASR
jgi:ribulose bisphosphate carboxylase small subunit